MRNIKLLIEYDGTNYAGWQRQKNALTIQETLEKAIEKITGETVEVTGSSRTDAGVHARGFTANFLTESSIPEQKFKDAINSKLPLDIVVMDSMEVDLDFHSRYSSKGKTYSYTLLNRKQPAAINRNYMYHYKYGLDLEAMKDASRYFIGTHDFMAFRNTGSSVKTTVRTITQLDIIKDEEMIRFIISADGFLYNMVRIIVGTLLEVGLGKLNPEKIQEIIASKDRTKAGKSVPAAGLCLEEVFY